jgi:NAD(P)-dependent dehydrogenase (short-subunit alcohol dehydrogenase family)
MTRVIARQYAAKKIRCNVILLGMMDTPHIRTYYRDMPPDEVAKIMRQRDSHCPMGRQVPRGTQRTRRCFLPPTRHNASPAQNWSSTTV